MNASAIAMGLLAAFVGYAASFAIVLAGLNAMGATEAQAATGLFFATLGMGVCSIWLPLATRIPAAVAWSTPGAAFLAANATLPGGLQTCKRVASPSAPFHSCAHVWTFFHNLAFGRHGATFRSCPCQ